MATKFTFKSQLHWHKKDIEELSMNNKSSKNHSISIMSKTTLQISAAKEFKGDPTLHNPEDLLLSALSSCHMMSYLYCCQKHNIDVISYEDSAEAILEVSPNGSGKIIAATLFPSVTIADKEQIDDAMKLHHDANELCFIANSCNFPIKHFPTIHIA